MRSIFYVAAGMILLIVLVIGGAIGLVGGSISWFANRKVEVVNEPAVAEAFKTTFRTTCSNLASKGVTDYQAVALIKQVCACDANALMAIMRRNKDMTIGQLQKRLTSRDPEIIRAFETCNQAYGIDVVPE